jgi:phospholipase C
MPNARHPACRSRPGLSARVDCRPFVQQQLVQQLRRAVHERRGPGPDGEALTPCGWDQPVIRVDDITSQKNRAACKYQCGDMPAASLGPSIPIDVEMPIDNIVVVMMENHSFDSYLGHLNAYAHRTDIESADAGATDSTVDGGTAPWTHALHECSAPGTTRASSTSSRSGT